MAMAGRKPVLNAPVRMIPGGVSLSDTVIEDRA